MLAAELGPALSRQGFHVQLVTRAACDITRLEEIEATMDRLHPELVLNCAAYTRVDRAEAEPEAAFAVNALGAGHVARAAAAVGARLVHVSTDYVFDGTLGRPYTERDVPSPLGSYARSKLEGELRVASAISGVYIVRTGELYGTGGPNFFSAILARARSGAALRVVNDQVVSPTWTRELATQIALLVRSAPPGLYHATADGETTWFEAAREALRLVGLDDRVEPVSTAAWGSPTPRPRYSVLAHTALDGLGIYCLRHWQVALREWLLDSPWKST
jgi:dTDP-4-dehydrorhamnose reductase